MPERLDLPRWAWMIGIIAIILGLLFITASLTGGISLPGSGGGGHTPPVRHGP